MKKPVLSIIIFICLVNFWDGFAQKSSDGSLFNRKRKKAELSNYYYSLNIINGLNKYSGEIEWKVDSLIKIEPDPEIRKNMILLKYHLINVNSKTTFHTDPIVAGLDTWVLCYQLQDYFESDRCHILYGDHCKVFSNIFRRYRKDYELRFKETMSDENIRNIENFAMNFPITDDNLHRESVTPVVSEWIAGDNLGIKGGLLTMTDLVRDMSDRMEYYTEMIPKQTKWQIDYSLASLASDDSITILISDIQNLIRQSGETIGKTEDMINFNRDSVLEFMDHQRAVSFQTLRDERIATMETMSGERGIILEAMQKERMAIEKFGEQQRIAMTEDMKEITAGLMEETTKISKELIDYVFIRLLTVAAILGVSVVLGMVLYKKL